MAVEVLDLITYVKGKEERCLEDSVLCGRVTRFMPRPTILASDVELTQGGRFVEMDVFSVTLPKQKEELEELGIDNSKLQYMVNGKVVAYVDNVNIILKEWYMLEGTLRMAKRHDNVFGLFNFTKITTANHKKWVLKGGSLKPLNLPEWDFNSECFKWLRECSENNDEVIRPASVLSFPKFYSEEQRLNDSLTMPSALNVPEVLNVSSVVSEPVNIQEDRTRLKGCSDLARRLRVNIDGAKYFEKAYIKKLSTAYGFDNVDIMSYVQYILNGLRMFHKRKSSADSMTGFMVLKKYLNTVPGSDEKVGGKTVATYLASDLDTIVHFIADNNYTSGNNKVDTVLCNGFSDLNRFYIGIVGAILNISDEDLNEICTMCYKQRISPVKVFNNNPYLLLHLSHLSYDDIEYIAMCFKKHNDESLVESRNICLIHAYITSSLNGSTVFDMADLKKANIGVRLTTAKFEKVRTHGTYLTSGTIANINCFLMPAVASDFAYNLGGFRSCGGAKVKVLTEQALSEAVADYLASGVGVKVRDTYITSTRIAEKELYVFETMIKLGLKTYNYAAEDIDKYISEYENLVGFKLEEKQRTAVHLVVNGSFIVAGSAGSGKTTVSNCVVYVLSKLEPELEVKFAAPTGKAARRLAEVVHAEVKTIHSMFGLGLTATNNIFGKDKVSSTVFENTAFFIDEGAMCTLDLFYKLLKGIDVTTCRLFISGDTNQLPPIGKGQPFKDFLKYMPCVYLTVTKRACEGSQITKASNLINNNSDKDNWQDITSGKDFYLLPTDEATMQKAIYDLCAYYLGKKTITDIGYIQQALNLVDLPKVDNLTATDIQVITPFAKASVSWGTVQLNNLLKPLFNPNTAYSNTFVYQTSKVVAGQNFSIGDRVIHTDRNMYSMQWYESYKNGKLTKMYGQGVNNGDVGHIVDFVPMKQLTIKKERKGTKPENYKYSNVRDDSKYTGDKNYGVIVEYFDYVSNRNYYILYRAELNTKLTSNVGLVLKGADIGKLALFYAGTTHKFQGSQQKVVICALGSLGYEHFITRQMVYTMFTRGESLVYAVGSVSNDKYSMLSRARRDVASLNTNTVGHLLAL